MSGSSKRRIIGKSNNCRIIYCTYRFLKKSGGVSRILGPLGTCIGQPFYFFTAGARVVFFRMNTHQLACVLVLPSSPEHPATSCVCTFCPPRFGAVPAERPVKASTKLLLCWELPPSGGTPEPTPLALDFLVFSAAVLSWFGRIYFLCWAFVLFF